MALCEEDDVELNRELAEVEVYRNELLEVCVKLKLLEINELPEVGVKDNRIELVSPTIEEGEVD